jgi:hypothetical protein
VIDSLRAWVQQHALLVLIAIGIVVAGVAAVQLPKLNRVDRMSATAYYTTDDGATFFQAPVQTPPFKTKDGKEAVAAVLFARGDGSPAFVGYLIRCRADARAAEDRQRQTGAVEGVAGGAPRMVVGMQVKRPGAGEWVDGDTPEGMAIKDVRLPDGRIPVPIIPE